MTTTLGTFDLAITTLAAILLPLIVVLNYRLRSRGGTAFSTYMWQRHPTLTHMGLALVGLLGVTSMIDLAAHYGHLDAASHDTAMLLAAVPSMVLAVAVLVLGARAAVQGYRERSQNGPA